MSAKLCSQQEFCHHYKTGDNKPHNHDIRNKYPCLHWLALDCEKMLLLAELQGWTTGEIMSCDISKITRIKRELTK